MNDSTNNKKPIQSHPKKSIDIEELRRLKQAKKEAKKKLNAAANQNNKQHNEPPKVLERFFATVPYQTSLKVVSGSIRVMTFNILAQSLIKRELFPESGDVLKWKIRRRMIIDEIKLYNPDIISLQELDNFESYYEAIFTEMGYKVKYDCHPSKRHGCGIAYKEAKLIEVSYETIDYNTDTLCPPSYLTGNIAQLLALKINNDIGFVIGNTHLYWRPTSNYERFRQTLIYVNRFLEFKSKLKPNMKWISFLLGDFNTTPDDPAYGILTTNELTKEQTEDLNVSRVYKKPKEDKEIEQEAEEEDENTTSIESLDSVDQLVSKYNKNCQWESIYSHYRDVTTNKEELGLFGEPKITNYTVYFKGILDYMFIPKKDPVHIKQILMLPQEADLKPSLPNRNFGSDHLCLVTDIEY
ncbi:Endonuclease/exonuclease/phosphatase [Cokeromyces recurvatus]|uniref:Endonuclease/exonuclease/phosphatase n=1 Tax=Cokeromyces recurvatus TaxID=90255 RepID=UPI00222001C0|nr:Endonuclease/exonuclease/phosphatase [Cokeromyces recurvatus]KAI7897576.1 Endonuclease/exonuclease/phosphatase [Cokeromyces recurvatus]